MEIKTIITVIIAGMLGVLVFSAMLPVFSDMTDGTDTFTNEGTRMSPVEDKTITITYANDNWNVNGVDLGFGSFPVTQGTIMIYAVSHSERSGYLYLNDNGSYSRGNIQRGGEHTYIYDGANKTVDVTSIVNGTTYTGHYTYIDEVYYSDPNGEYIDSPEKPTNAYIPEDWDHFNAWSVGSTHFYAIIGDILLVDGDSAPEGTTTTLELGDVDNYTGIKTIESYTLNLPDEDPIDCRGYILPYEVVGERIIKPDASTTALLNLLPVLIAIGLIMGIAGAIFIKRM